METSKKPIITEKVDLPKTKGLYSFFTQTCYKLYIIIMAILKTIKTPYDKLKKAQYEILVDSLWVVNHMAKKLAGISSISTSVHDNLFCKCRQKITDCICQYCYAFSQQAYQTGLREHNILNGFILRNILIPVPVFKRLNIMFPYLRIESFGDVSNVIQARNYIRIIKAFPSKRCAIWSKNIETWHKAILEEGKPKNTTFVYSSSFLNKPVEFDKEKYCFVDHVFTVYTKQYAKEHNIIINCGGKKCITCILNKKNCYFRNTTFYINELKK